MNEIKLMNLNLNMTVLWVGVMKALCFGLVIQVYFQNLLFFLFVLSFFSYICTFFQQN